MRFLTRCRDTASAVSRLLLEGIQKIDDIRKGIGFSMEEGFGFFTGLILIGDHNSEAACVMGRPDAGGGILQSPILLACEMNAIVL